MLNKLGNNIQKEKIVYVGWVLLCMLRDPTNIKVISSLKKKR